VHGDHCYGLPGLLASAAMSGRTAALPIIAPKGIETWVRAQGDLIPQKMLFGINSLARPTGHFPPYPVQTRLCNAFLSPAQPFQNSTFAW
jgi:ribonuclease BN (tRNA processing enzyme)